MTLTEVIAQLRLIDGKIAEQCEYVHQLQQNRAELIRAALSLLVHLCSEEAVQSIIDAFGGANEAVAAGR